MSSFETLGVRPEIIDAVTDMGWLLPRDVQDEAIPKILGGADVLISSETGTGKTGALALPTMQIIYESLRGEANTHLSRASGNQPLITKDGKPNIRLSTVDRETAVAIDNEGLLVQSRDGNWMGVRTLVGVAGRAQVGNVRKIQTDHKWYFEMYPTDDGLSRVGVSTGTATLALGTDKQSWGCGGTGMASHDGNFVKAGLPFKNKDVVGIALDLNPSPSGLGTLSLTVNGSPLEVIHSNLPLDTPLYPAVYLKNAEVKFSFSGPFKHLPQGYRPIADCDVNYTNAVSPSTTTSSSSTSTQSKSESKDDGKYHATYHTLALIVEPTRELAQQVYTQLDQFRKYLTEPPVTIKLLSPGDGGRVDMADMKKGANIVVGTLGLLTSMVQQRTLLLDKVKFFILDEADIMLMNDTKSIMQLYQALPRATPTTPKPQIIVCSATLHSPAIQTLAKQMCEHPQLVDLKGEASVPESVDHLIFPVSPRQDLSWIPTNWGNDAVNRILKDTTAPSASSNSSSSSSSSSQSVARPVTQQFLSQYTDDIHPRLGTDGRSSTRDQLSIGVKTLKLYLLVRIIAALKPSQCLIFCRTQVDCDKVRNFLASNIAAEVASNFMKNETKTEEKQVNKDTNSSNTSNTSTVVSKLNEYPPASAFAVLHGAAKNRQETMDAFRSGDVRILISTDVAARGLDVQGLPLVINFTLPDMPETYIHRVGRTGRAGNVGMAVSLVAEDALERVWWHTCPNRGGNNTCQNTELKDTGRGCTMWYDEPSLLQQIEARLAAIRIPRADINTLKEGMSRVEALAATSRPSLSRTALDQIQHVEIIAPQAQRLSKLEGEAQRLYWHTWATGKKWKTQLSAAKSTAMN